MNSQSRLPNGLLAIVAVCAFAFGVPRVAFSQPSNHGYYWTEVSAAAPWATRAGPGVVAFKDKLWVIGGYHPPSKLNDVWSSVDGVTWKPVTSAAPWVARLGLGRVVVFADKLWVLGGDASAPGDIWSSPDGANWTQVLPNTPWALRTSYGVRVFQDKLWILGGAKMSGLPADFSDVWNSPDGANWTQVVAAAGWPPRSVYAGTVFQGKLWVLGGQTDVGCGQYLHDAWSSPDGVTWSQAAASNVGFKCPVVEFDGCLWDLDRGRGSGCYPPWVLGLNEVWRSADGARWEQLPNAPWEPRLFQGSVVFGGKLWVLGGERDNADYTPLNDVWNLTPVSLGIDTGQRLEYAPGDKLTLKVTATGLSGQVGYQWSKNGSAIPDATADSYQVDSFTADDAGAYTCELSGGTFGTAGPVQIALAPAKAPAAGTVGIALGVALAAAFVFLRRKAYSR